MDIELIYTLVEKGGIIALLIIAVIGLIYYINSKTVSKEQYEENIRKIEELRTEVKETVGPTMDRLTRIMEKQDQINSNLSKQVEMQGRFLSEMSKDIHLVSHELKMQRLESPKTKKK